MIHNARKKEKEIIDFISKRTKRIKVGPGIFEFLDTGNIMAYTPGSDTLTLNELENLISKLWN